MVLLNGHIYIHFILLTIIVNSNFKMLLRQIHHYKFGLENSAKIRLKEFFGKASFTLSSIQDDEELLQQLQFCIDSLNSKIYRQSLDCNDQNEIDGNIKLIIFFILLEKPIIDNFFQQFNNEQFLLDIFNIIQGNTSKISALSLYKILCTKKSITHPELFTEIFAQYFFETELFEEDEETKICFILAVENLLLNFDQVQKVFNKAFMDHFTEVIKNNTEDQYTLYNITLYFNILQNFNGYDFNDEITDFEFFDFLEEYIISLDLMDIKVQYQLIYFLINVSYFDFFTWLYQEPFIQKISMQLIENSYEDNILFLLILGMAQMKNDLIHLIKAQLYQVVLFKINELIEIQIWTENENYISRKIIKALHFLWQLTNIDEEEKNYENKINVLVFLSNLYDKSIFEVKAKATSFLSVFTQDFFSAQMPIDTMNLIADIFMKCIDLDTNESKILLFSGFYCLFSKMQQTELYDDFVNAFIETNIIECLRDVLENHSLDDESYSYVNKFLEILGYNSEEEEE